MDYLSNAGAFLIGTLFDLYILAVLLRFLLQLVRADFYNPVSQFLVKVTNPLLKPLRRLIPGWGGMDLASVLLLLGLKLMEVLLLALLFDRALPAPAGLLVLVLAQLLRLTLTVYFWSIIVQVILSWVSPGSYTPVSYLLYQLNRPLLHPAQRLLPPIGGFDLSPILVLLALQLAQLLIVQPIIDLGLRLA